MDDTGRFVLRGFVLLIFLTFPLLVLMHTIDRMYPDPHRNVFVQLAADGVFQVNEQGEFTYKGKVIK